MKKDHNKLEMVLQNCKDKTMLNSLIPEQRGSFIDLAHSDGLSINDGVIVDVKTFNPDITSRPDILPFFGAGSSRANMSMLTRRLAEKATAGLPQIVFNLERNPRDMELIGQQLNQLHDEVQRVMRVGRKTNNKTVAVARPVPYYRRFEKQKF